MQHYARLRLFPLAVFVILVIDTSGRLIAQPPPPPPPPPPGIPTCPITYFGEVNGAHHYETASNTCSDPFGLGMTGTQIANLGCSGITGMCLSPIDPTLVFATAAAPGTAAAVPADFDEAVAFLEQLRSKLVRLAGSGEVSNRHLDSSGGHNFNRKQMVRDLRDYTVSYRSWMLEASTPAEKHTRFQHFLNEFVPVFTSNVLYGRWVRSGGSTTSWSVDLPSQTSLVDAAQVMLIPQGGATVVVIRGPLVRVMPGGGVGRLFFQTLYVGYNGKWRSIGVQVNPPGNHSSALPGRFVDRHSFSHRIAVNSTGTLFTVTTAEDQSFSLVP